MHDTANTSGTHGWPDEETTRKLHEHADMQARIDMLERELADARGLVAECLALNPIVSGDEVRVWSDVTKRMTWSDVTKRMTAFAAGDPGSEWMTLIAELERELAEARAALKVQAGESDTIDELASIRNALRLDRENARLRARLGETRRAAEAYRERPPRFLGDPISRRLLEALVAKALAGGEGE